MDNSLLNQILHEYELKRNKAILEAEKRKKELLKKYKSLTNIKNQSLEELQTILPENVAKELLENLKEI